MGRGSPWALLAVGHGATVYHRLDLDHGGVRSTASKETNEMRRNRGNGENMHAPSAAKELHPFSKGSDKIVQYYVGMTAETAETANTHVAASIAPHIIRHSEYR